MSTNYKKTKKYQTLKIENYLNWKTYNQNWISKLTQKSQNSKSAKSQASKWFSSQNKNWNKNIPGNSETNSQPNSQINPEVILKQPFWKSLLLIVFLTIFLNLIGFGILIPVLPFLLTLKEFVLNSKIISNSSYLLGNDVSVQTATLLFGFLFASYVILLGNFWQLRF